MTRAEQEAFEKWMERVFKAGWKDRMDEGDVGDICWAFLSGYRAGFEAQHYEVDDGK